MESNSKISVYSEELLKNNIPAKNMWQNIHDIFKNKCLSRQEI